MVQKGSSVSADTFPVRFEWCAVPGGQVTLKAGGYLAAATVMKVAPFAIARYPVTNRQYAAFMEAGGYADPAWWTPTGWRMRERHGWTEPRSWRSTSRPDCPVINISFHEAYAFCRWASAITGEAVTLPTEQQWQRAAQGDDGREFPWGADDPDEMRCNWARNNTGLTPVDFYPDGVSPFGVWDMCGNAWEYCLTEWATGATDPDSSERRVVRGGSWVNDSPLTLRAVLRDGPYPLDGYQLCGFRPARASQ